MGCGHSKEDVETGHIHIKTKRKCKKSRENKGENTQLTQQKEQKEEEVAKENTLLEKNEETLNGDIEGLICDGISGKTEYFSPKKTNLGENGHDDFNEEKEREFLNDEKNQDLSIEQVICDGVSGKTEYYSPKRANDEVEKEGNNDDGNGNLSTEGVICDGCSGKTGYYSPKKPSDDVEVEDKEVLVEEKTGEGKKTGDGEKAEERGNNEVVGEIEDVSSLKKSADDVDEKDFPSNEKACETETTIHVSGYAFDTLLSWWKTREV